MAFNPNLYNMESVSKVKKNNILTEFNNSTNKRIPKNEF